MKTVLSTLVVALSLAAVAPALAQDAATTKAACEKAKGTWDEASQKCMLPK